MRQYFIGASFIALYIQFSSIVFADTPCSDSEPCVLGCCSAANKICGYGPDYCASTKCSAGASENGTCSQLSECDPGKYPGWGTVWGSTYAAAESCPLNVCCSEFGFCGTTADFCGTATVTEPSCSGSSASSGRNIGYYELFSQDRPCDVMTPEEIPLGGYTHIYAAFLYVDPTTFAITPMESNEGDLYSRLTALKNRQESLEVWISIGGWDFTDPGVTGDTFSTLAGDDSAQNAFFGSLLAFLAKYGFDGIDFDWEYPVAPERNGNPDDYANYVTLLKRLRNSLDSTGRAYGLSITLPSSYWYMQNFDIVSMSQIVDWFNIMTYDLHGTWDSTDKYIGSVINAHTNLTEIVWSMDLLWRNNIPPSQVNMGLGFYGRSFTLSDPSCTAAGCPFSAGGNAGTCTQNVGTLSYTEIEAIISDPSNHAAITLDEAAAVQIVVWNTDQWVSFDNAESFALKIDYANSHCLGGTFVWAVSLDNDGTATDALRNITANDTFPGDDGSNNGSGDVYIGPDLWTNSTQSIGCIPPCTFVLPPLQLGSTSTIVDWPPLTTSVLSSSAGTIFTKTTTIDIPAFEMTEISFWAVTVVPGDPDQVYFVPEQSVMPPSMTLELPGTEAPFPVTSIDYTSIAQSATVSSTPTTMVSTPAAVQAGIATNCVQFYEAVSGDGCDAIAMKFGITDAEFYAWNPAVGGSACSGLWLNEYYCVAIAGSASTESHVTTPAAVQTGIASDCTQFYQVMSGDGCDAIAAKFHITDDEFYAWNPAIGGSSCVNLWLSEYYCVAVATSFASSGTTVVPVFFTSSHVITIQPQATSSIHLPKTITPISYATGTPPSSGGCSDVAKLLKLPGCGSHDCGIFGCGGHCGVFGCDGGCGFDFCGGGCGLGYCGPGCGDGNCVVPTGGGGKSDDSTSTKTESESCTATTYTACETVFATLGGTGTTSCFTETADCSTGVLPPFAQYTEIDDPIDLDENDAEINSDALYIATLMNPILGGVDPAQVNGTALSAYLASQTPTPTKTSSPSQLCSIEGDPSATPEYWCICGTTTVPTMSGKITSPCAYTSLPAPRTTSKPTSTLPANGFGYTWTDISSNIIVCASSSALDLGLASLVTVCEGSSSTVFAAPTPTTASPSAFCTAVGTLFDGVKVYIFTNYVTDNGAALEAAEKLSCGIEGFSGFSAFGTHGDSTIQNSDGSTWEANRMFHFTLNDVTHPPELICIETGIEKAGGPSGGNCPFEPALNAIVDELVDIFDEVLEVILP